jgi:hypothetical protein
MWIQRFLNLTLGRQDPLRHPTSGVQNSKLVIPGYQDTAFILNPALSIFFKYIFTNSKLEIKVIHECERKLETQ